MAPEAYTFERVSALLREHADQETAKAMSAYMKNHFPFLGIKKPQREALCKPFLQAWKKEQPAYQELGKLLWQQEAREFQYLALEFLKTTKKQWDRSTPAFWEELITTKSWWDTVDLIASHLVGDLMQLFPEQKEKVLPGWIQSENLWLNRTAILFQLRYRTQTSPEWLEKSILPHLGSKEFFHQKAIGWALRQYSAYNPDWVVGFVEKNPLAPLSKREALRKLV